MQVKKFLADSISEATQMVRNALGPDALILSTKRIESKAKGYGKVQFEIWAVPHDVYGEHGSHLEVSSETIKGMKTDIHRIRDMLSLMTKEGGIMERLTDNPDALELYAKLVKTGISEKYVRHFIQKGGACDRQPFVTGRLLHRRVLGEMMKVVKVADPFAGKKPCRRVAAFVGPTGVGKTTTIAKLAADIKLKKKKSVGLVSIDHYRMGAMEQLKSYASILGVPCFPAYNSQDLKFALRRLSNKDVVLIDTAGQSQYDKSRMDELTGFVQSDSAITSHLLLNTSINETDMTAAAKNFGKLNVDSYIFTKIDEAKERGVIMNEMIRSKVPVSFVTTGQRVPEDLLKATKTGILSLLFQKTGDA